jgi:HrpA-like RNA helicase
VVTQYGWVEPILTAAAVRHLHATTPDTQGAILVILPGWEDIMAVRSLLNAGDQQWAEIVRAGRDFSSKEGEAGDDQGQEPGVEGLVGAEGETGEQTDVEEEEEEEVEAVVDQSTLPDYVQTVLPPPRVVGGLWVVPIHSELTLDEQKLGFKRPPPGARKVVLATNVAETSITIPDVVYVVDSGLQKQRVYDPVNKLSMLSTLWVSRASAQQRR